MKVKLQK